MTSLDEINREFERLHQLMRELNTVLDESQIRRRQMDALMDESQTLRRHIGVAIAKLALCLREAEDDPQDDHL